jgi:hypothetical protein
VLAITHSFGRVCLVPKHQFVSSFKLRNRVQVGGTYAQEGEPIPAGYRCTISRMSNSSRGSRFISLSNAVPATVREGKRKGEKSLAKYSLGQAAGAEAQQRLGALLGQFPLYPEIDLDLLLACTAMDQDQTRLGGGKLSEERRSDVALT